MNQPHWNAVMAYYISLWPHAAPEVHTQQAWYTVLGGYDQATVAAALRDLASEPGRVYGPTTGEITAAIRDARRPRPPEQAALTPPARPAGAAARDARRARVLAKLVQGAVDPDGRPASDWWEDDADLWAWDTDPLIQLMVDAHCAERRHLTGR